MRSEGKAPAAERQRLTVRGVVQGVGFRPFVHTLAVELGLGGFVRNIEGGVEIEVEGDAEALARFESRLRGDAPPLAELAEVGIETLTPCGAPHFTIAESRAGADALTPVSPDVTVCADCLAEMRDPRDRRFGYPFVNCTNCGPRFTIVADVPYDRPNTTMRSFALCPECAAEYEDPADRRYHAQPVACPVCGPHVECVDPAQPESTLRDGDAIRAAQEAIAAGRIVAIKGIGGFHLACDATRPDAVARLRERKGRGLKPFAMMASSLEIVRRYADLSPAEARLLESAERPIVLVRRRRENGSGPLLAGEIAPGQAWLGFLLPYTPLHALLLGETPWVMTSGNRSEEPIARDNDEALERLSTIADLFLLHDRPIEVVADDSVVRLSAGMPLPIRRSRGIVPRAVALARPGHSVLAVGGDLKGAFCLTRESHALLSQHLGDMENLETLAAAERALDHFRRLFRIRPEIIVCDLHPGYFSARWAERLAEETGLPRIAVQHHHAHAASVMAENRHAGERPVLAFTFDGTGYGPDGAIWGGELLLASYSGYERLAHLAPVPLPGGDAAIRHPAHVALTHLNAAGLPLGDEVAAVRALPAAERRVLERQLETGFATVPSTSMGRLFDAVAVLLGFHGDASYEGQPAMELEAMAMRALRRDARPTELDDFAIRDETPWILDPAPVLRSILERLARDPSEEHRATLAAGFHSALARAVVALAQRARTATGLTEVALSGGVFQNVLLVDSVIGGLGRAGFRVLRHRRVPPNDGGLALGQAAIAAYAPTTNAFAPPAPGRP